MKKLFGVSLFIFWAFFTAALVAGLVFYQNSRVNISPTPATGMGVGVGSGGPVTLNMQEIAKHNSASDCWLLISNKVYNVTSYLGAHPGGAGAIIVHCGTDATQAFATKDIGRPHSQTAANELALYYIGDFNQTIGQQQVQQSVQTTNSVPPPRGGENDD